MKFKVITILVMSLGCQQPKQIVESPAKESTKEELISNPNSYYVQSFYLQDSTYIIRVKRNDSLFKIISPLKDPLFVPPMLKSNLPPCDRLIEGKYYELEIRSLFSSWVQLEGLILYNGSVITFDKESNYDLYVCENLRGICYIKLDSLKTN